MIYAKFERFWIILILEVFLEIVLTIISNSNTVIVILVIVILILYSGLGKIFSVLFFSLCHKQPTALAQLVEVTEWSSSSSLVKTDHYTVVIKYRFTSFFMKVKNNHPVREDGSNVNFVGTFFLYFFFHVLLVCKGLVAYVDIILQCEWKLPVCEAHHWNCNFLKRKKEEISWIDCLFILEAEAPKSLT